MTPARNFLLLVMLLLAMPWGAYLRTEGPASLQGEAVHRVTPPESVAAQAGASEQAASFRQSRKCRVATLTGSACAADMALLTAINAAAPVVAFDDPPSALDMSRAGLSIAPDTGPPRSV